MKQKPISGFPGYEVTSDGRVWSNRTWRGKVGRWLQSHRRADGHMTVAPLDRSGRFCGVFVHRLVLETFVGPCPEGMEACHNNGDPSDNRLENLRWDTRAANMRDAIKHGTHPGFKNRGSIRPRGEQSCSARMKETDVRWVEYLYRAGMRVKDLSKIFSISPQHVCSIGKHRFWRYLWA